MTTATSMTTTKHGPATRHIDISQRHAGQIVTPVIEAYHIGRTKYLVVLAWYDAADQSTSTPEEFIGDFWACTNWLKDHGVSADINAA